MPPLLDAIITGYIAGDTLNIPRRIPAIPTGRTLVKSWLTIKTAETDVDPGLVQKVITTVNQGGIGQITDDGHGGSTLPVGTGSVNFVLTAAETGVTLGPNKVFVYDIQHKFDNGDIATTEKGKIDFKPGVTAAIT
jgi:hypothetical protein